MAKKSKVQKNLQRIATEEKYREKRHALLATIADPKTSDEDRAAAQQTLWKLPRDASPTRIRNRGASDGRPRGYLRKFGLSRVQMREEALAGNLPGVTKSSW